MSAELNVSAGPFAGKTLRGNLSPSMNDITTVATVDAVQATQVFLDTFRPADGWTISLTGEVLDINMVPLQQPGRVDVHCPTALFKASLLKDGVVVNQSSTLWVLSGPTEWEKGETNARLRLYAAMGLPVRQDLGIIEPLAAKPRPQLTAVPNPYKDRDARKTDEAEVQVSDQAGAAVEEGDGTNAEADAPAEAQQTAAPVVTQRAEPLVLNGDGPNKALLENIKRICGMRGIEMPELTTKAEAEDFLKTLLKRAS